MELFLKLLWRRQSKWQLYGAGMGVAIGLFLVLGAVQLYLDVNHYLHKDQGADPQFVQINKRVNLLNTLTGASSFSEKEIEEIMGHSFVRSVGVFTSNNFHVSASSESLGFYTELFFESVPYAFLDVKEPRFRWEEGDEEVPILLSRDYLALYNFGFAPSQGLPQLTPNTIQRMTFDLAIGDHLRRARMQGRIVGFSDRYNSILVPQGFMDWANRTFGDTTAQKGPSRLVMEVDNPQSAAFLDFIEENNFELSAGRLVGGQVQTMVGFMTLILLFIGGLIFVLSMVIILLNFRLLIEGARTDIELLLQLGYRQSQITNFLFDRMLRWFSSVAVTAFLAFLFFHALLARAADGQGIDIPAMAHPLVWGLAAVLSAGVVYLNYVAIRRNIAGS
jgi:hypothetical protein